MLKFNKYSSYDYCVQINALRALRQDVVLAHKASKIYPGNYDFFFLVFLPFSRAAPAAYGGSQTRGLMEL